MKSLRELFRIGHGPSSSHTMGPYYAAEIFRKNSSNASRYEVTLYGSLAATGKGHFTDQAILAGLQTPDKTKILWKPQTVLPEHPNGMKFCAFDEQDKLLNEWTVFSIGGGALSENGLTEPTPEIYPYRDMKEIMEVCNEKGVHLWELVKLHEDENIFEYLDQAYRQMVKTLDDGLAKDGVLPGELHLARKARSVYRKARAQRSDIRRTGIIASFAYAVAEENASLGTVVTAPTCGSCGILPAILRYIELNNECSHLEILHALATAGLIGSLVKQNGSISGAEVGCQGEVGVACAMAAAAAAYLFGGTVPQCEYAAEIGLEHFLGLTCDPILGLVQIPCIERNALAANRAIVAAEMALLSDGQHRVSLDAVIRTMLETGHDLPSLYRETSTGGLSVFAGRK